MARRRISPVAAVVVAALGLVPDGARAGDKLACVAAIEAAQTLRAEGKLRAARDALIRCAQASCPKVVRDDCATGLREVESETPSIVVRARDSAGNDLPDAHLDAGGARLADRLDGHAISLDPGAITVRVGAEGFSPKEIPLVVARGEKARLVVVTLEGSQASRSAAPAPLAPRGGGSPAPWILLGLGAASLGTFGVLEGIAQDEYADLEAGCGATRSCSEDAMAPTRTKFIAAGVALGVGLAAIGAAATIWIVSDPEGDPGVRAGLAVSPAGVALRGSF